MSDETVSFIRRVQSWIQRLSLALFAFIATTLIVTSLLAAFGILPWLTITAAWGDSIIPWAGKALQLFMTGLMIALAFFIPSSNRVLQLENSHRDFRLRANDIAHAYNLCHAADRDGVFTLSSDFDTTRERIEYLISHPDLEHLEDDLLQVAAQMSVKARELADIYSDEKVERARAFLKQRQQEITRTKGRIEKARQMTHELSEWAQRVGVQDTEVRSHLVRLELDLFKKLEPLGFEVTSTKKVVPLGLTAVE